MVVPSPCPPPLEPLPTLTAPSGNESLRSIMSSTEILFSPTTVAPAAPAAAKCSAVWHATTGSSP